MSTGSNYPNSLDLWANKNAGDEISPAEVNQWRSAIEQIERRHFPMLGTLTQITVTNTTAEINLFTIPIVANSLSPTGALHGHALINVASMINNEVLNLRFYWGGTQFWSPQVINQSGSTQGFGIPIHFTIFNANSTGTQGLMAEAQLPGTNLLRWNVSGGVSATSVGGSLSKDTTITQNFAINVAWSNTTPANSLVGLGCFIQGRFYTP